jgi:hypothetical protein
VLDLLGAGVCAEVRSVQQLLPELAGEIADSDMVVFLDAAADCEEVRVESVPQPGYASRMDPRFPDRRRSWPWPELCSGSKGGRVSAHPGFRSCAKGGAQRLHGRFWRSGSANPAGFARPRAAGISDFRFFAQQNALWQVERLNLISCAAEEQQRSSINEPRNGSGEAQ